MNKKLISSLLVIMLSFSTSYTTLANDLSPQEEAIKENKVKFQQLDSEILKVNDEIAKLSSEIGQINAQLEDNINKINETENQIKETENQLTETKEDIEENQELLGGRMRGMYKSGPSNNYIAFILGADNISDLLSRLNSMKKIISLDKQLIQELDEKQKELDAAIDDLDKKQTELENLKKSNEESISTLNDKKSQQQTSLNKLNEQKAEVEDIIASNEDVLISKPLSIINSSYNKSDLTNAVDTLNNLLPQLNTQWVKNKAQSAINEATAKISAMNNSNNSDNSSNQNSTTEYKATYSMVATAYTGGGLTATGLKPVRNPNGISTIAVDPKVIPLGSKVYIPGYGYAIASDTGGAIKGNKIDLYLNSESECYAWGRRTVTLHVVAYPGEW